MPVDQRRDGRVPVELPARLVFVLESVRDSTSTSPSPVRSPRASFVGTACNLSRRGMWFLASSPATEVELGAREAVRGALGSVRVELRLPDASEPLLVDGEVRRHALSPGAQGLGICFTHLTGPARRRLANFMIEQVTLRLRSETG